MNKINRIMIVMRKELLHICRDNIALMIAFIAPFLLTGLVGFLYIQQKVTEMPIAIYDQDQTDVSRSIIRSFADSERFRILVNCNSYQELKTVMEAEKVYMGVVIPPRLKEDIKAGNSTEVGLILNGTNLLIMNTVANAASQIVQTINAGITMRIMQGFGITRQKAYQAVTALNFRTRIWYNPTSSYLVFMLIGLLGTVIQQVTFLGVALSFAKERENGTWRQLVFSELKTSDIIAGKLLLYFLIYTINALIIYGLGISYFGVPMRGNAVLLMGTIILFILVLLAMGMAISIIAGSTPQAIEISMLIAVPSFLISGYTWPWLSMPWPIQILSKILPLTHFLEAIRAIMYIGSGFEVVWPKLATLLAFAIVCLPGAALLLKRKMMQN